MQNSGQTPRTEAGVTVIQSARQSLSSQMNLSSHAVAGLLAGFVSSVVTHPLDVVKTRFQVQDGVTSSVPKYKSTFHALVTIVRTEGVTTLYAGLTPNLLGSTIAWGCYFYSYNYLKGLARADGRLLDARGQLGPLVNMACATCAGIGTCLATNPIWLVKTRLQLQSGGLNKAGGTTGTQQTVRYRGMVDGFRQVIKSDGIFGLYRGLVPSLFLVSHGAIQFMAYEELKKLFRHYWEKGDDHLHTWQTLLTSSMSKVFASAVTYPNQVVRSRLQQVDPNLAFGGSHQGEGRYYKGTLDVIVKTLRREGVLGFYKGLAPNLMRVVPSSAITFLVYETVTKFLGAKT
uniref:Mitochondrial carrier protein n=1 Tax=Hanusia phi TaxID=3032 RepID=A0A7S0EFR5_9CRYP|mmetsp:Transcript_22679/g.51133  ORF Transcript_22679/g.51133 Transcript_22679/m.51133 type:complete len:345 (+) Transcript_22679:194-1228(+)